MANANLNDAEMDDLELFAGNWCGHGTGGGAPEQPAGASDEIDNDVAASANAALLNPRGNSRQVNDFINSQIQRMDDNGVGNTATGSTTGSTTGTGSETSGSSTYSERDPRMFGRGYIQCKSARIERLGSSATEVTPGVDLGKTVPANLEKIGNLDLSTDTDLLNTFRGSRVTSRGEVVNQTISFTFDPATLICTACKKPHSIIPTDGSELAVMVGDQNFVSTLAGSSSCVPVMRMEDPTLAELVEITMEVFDRCPLPHGTVFLIGSTSYLCEVGSTIYAQEWVKLGKDMKQRWMHTRVGPLPPILRESTPASTTKVIVEIHHWFNRIYGSDTVFMKSAWEKVIAILSENTDQTLDLANRETYRIALPISITSTTLTHYRFTASSSLPATAIFSREATDELVHALLTQLSTKIGCNAHPEDILAREPAELEGVENNNTKKIVVCGGSNCKRLAAYLTTLGIPVIDLCVPGWVPTPPPILASL